MVDEVLELSPVLFTGEFYITNKLTMLCFLGIFYLEAFHVIALIFREESPDTHSLQKD